MLLIMLPTWGFHSMVPKFSVQMLFAKRQKVILCCLMAAWVLYWPKTPAHIFVQPFGRTFFFNLSLNMERRKVLGTMSLMKSMANSMLHINNECHRGKLWITNIFRCLVQCQSHKNKLCQEGICDNCDILLLAEC